MLPSVASAPEANRSPSTLRKAGYALVALLLFWSIAEGIARLTVALDPSDRWNALADVLVTAGFPELHTILEPDEARFWRVRANLHDHTLRGRLGNSGEISFSVDTDASGRRITGPVEEPAHEVLFLGDSCTFGVGVENEETFAAVLQRRIASLRAINAGVPGYTAYQGRVTLEEDRPEREPAAVVISFLFNGELSWDGRGDLEHAEARATGMNRLVRRSRLLEIASRWLASRPQNPEQGAPTRPRMNDAEYAAELGKLIEGARARGAEPVLLVWPLARQMGNDRVNRKQFVMRKLARDHEARIVDLVAPFRAQGEPLFVDAVHANARGHRLIADRLEPEIRAAIGGAAR